MHQFFPNSQYIITSCTVIIETPDTAQKMKFSIKDFFSKCDRFPSFLVTCTEKILNGKILFLCSGVNFPSYIIFPCCDSLKMEAILLCFVFTLFYVKKVFLKISQYSQQSTCARISFLIKLQAEAATLLKERRWDKCFAVNFANILETLFYRTPTVTDSVCKTAMANTNPWNI